MAPPAQHLVLKTLLSLGFVLTVGLILLLAVSFGGLALGNHLINSPGFAFQAHQPLVNWDLKRHSMDHDLDGDGQEDLVSFTGCAFLTAATHSDIPAENHCRASGISALMPGSPAVGQKFVTSPSSDLTLTYGEGSLPFYAYLYQDSEGAWHIVVQEHLTGPLRRFTIDSQGELLATAVPFIHQGHVVAYTLTTLALYPVFFFLSVLSTAG